MNKMNEAFQKLFGDMYLAESKTAQQIFEYGYKAGLEEAKNNAAWAKHLKEPMSEKRVHESDTMERHVSYVCPQCHWTLEQQYDQTALELCDVCGWKTLIPDEGCLNCERGKPWVELTETERTNLEMLIIGQIQVTGLNVKGISNAIRAVEQVLKERNT